ncbi:MAG: serine/threonine-protein kinase [Acidobacteriota bacterium]|nr:serine/threonine-protein kinase [Acidobacteriota bacterium]
MPLTAGTRLGSYEIVAPLGAGGMGEVYRARDSRLGREVALKVLPESVASDRDRLTRFEQEARSASALNHPGIVTIYEVGKTDSISWIAMELVAGSTLRELTAGGPLPTKRVLALAAQIADALAKAHASGIVHRDLKPENVMVSKDGFVKVLDFGLAKLVETRDAVTSAETVNATRPGVVLGTAGYMSPEQASGRAVDFRSDQFSFGSVLYEMLTGKRAFFRNTTVETLTAIIRDEPEPIAGAAPEAPLTLRWMIERRCLAKDPEERYLSTRDLAIDLAQMRDHSSELSREALAVPAPARSTPRRFAAAAAASLVLFAVAAALFLRRGPREHDAPATRFVVSVPPGTTYAPPEISRGLSVSPDGTRIVFEAFSKGRRRLFVRPLDSEEATEIEGSLDATAHFWSPDSRFIAFYADGKLKKIPSAGGPPVTLCDAPVATVGTWNREGTILFPSFDPPGIGIFRVPENGGEPVRVLSSGSSGGAVAWPHFLPDGRRFLYLANTAAGPPAQLRLASLDSKETTGIAKLDSRVEYVPSGYLVYVREGTLFAQAFDERKGALRGEPHGLASGVHYFIGVAHAAFSVSQTGVVAYQTSPRPNELVWFDRTGKRLGQVGEAAAIKGLRLSPDGKRVAADLEDRRTGTSDIWVTELGPGVSTRIHSDSVDEKTPVWSPDGSKLVYRSDRKGPPDVYEIAPGTPGSERPLLEQIGVQEPADNSRDGRFLAYLNQQSSLWQIWLLPLREGGKPFPWINTRFDETSPRFSPDGRWIAFESNESGVHEIYAALTEGGADKRRISPSGGKLPRWRADGKELFYIAQGGNLMAVPVTPGARFETGAPAPLFRADPEFQNYDVTADGSKFLATVPLAKTPESPIRVIVNWTGLLTKER